MGLSALKWFGLEGLLRSIYSTLQSNQLSVIGYASRHFESFHQTLMRTYYN